MSTTINKNICIVGAFYQFDATKGRAKELIHELNSDERKLIISILNKTVDPSTNCQALTDKLIAIRTKDATDAFIPIAHEKDKDRSSCGKTLMNVWRTIKDFFGARISDKKLLKEINVFSKQEVMRTLDQIDLSYKDVWKSDSVDSSFDDYKFYLPQMPFYDLDLTTHACGLIFKQDFITLKQAFADKILLAIVNDSPKEDNQLLLSDYMILLTSNDFNNQFAGNFDSFQSLSVKDILEKIDQIGSDNLSEDQKNAAINYFISVANDLKNFSKQA